MISSCPAIINIAHCVPHFLFKFIGYCGHTDDCVSVSVCCCTDLLFSFITDKIQPEIFVIFWGNLWGIFFECLTHLQV